MTLEEGLYSRLTGYAGLSALIGTRLYPEVLPEGVTLPAVTYQIVSLADTADAAGGDNLMDTNRVQLTSYAATKAAAANVDRQIRAAINGYRGSMGTVVIEGCWRVNQIANYDPLPQLRQVISDYEITYHVQ